MNVEERLYGLNKCLRTIKKTIVKDSKIEIIDQFHFKKVIFIMSMF